MPKLQLTANQKIQVLEIVKKYLPEAEVIFFGSRSKGTAKLYSDLDIIIKDKKPISIKNFGLIQNSFSESDLPFKVDISDYSNLSQSFLKEVLKVKNE